MSLVGLLMGSHFWGVIFNYTAEAAVDKNHLKPHPALSARLKLLIATHDLKDV